MMLWCSLFNALISFIFRFHSPISVYWLDCRRVSARFLCHNLAYNHRLKQESRSASLNDRDSVPHWPNSSHRMSRKIRHQHFPRTHNRDAQEQMPLQQRLGRHLQGADRWTDQAHTHTLMMMMMTTPPPPPPTTTKKNSIYIFIYLTACTLISKHIADIVRHTHTLAHKNLYLSLAPIT